MGARAVLATVLASAVVACGESAPEPREVEGLPGSIVDVNGHYLYFVCTGSGSPTVLLEAGFGGATRNWRDVQAQLGGSTRTCSYDRAGLSGSSAIPGVHDADDEIRDLERLLDRAEIEPPYVLVGHSYGGLLVRLFAHDHPDEVAGIVLVDAVHSDQRRRLRAAIPDQPEFAEVRRDVFGQDVVNGVDVAASLALDRPLRSLGDTPLIVLTAGVAGAADRQLPVSVQRSLGGAWMSMQSELAALSSESVHAVAVRSGHFIQDRASGQPAVVIRAVRTLLRQMSLDSCTVVFEGLDVSCRS